MAVEPSDDNRTKALTVADERVNPPAMDRVEAVAAGAVAVGVLAAGSVALVRALARTLARTRRKDEPRAVAAPATARVGGGASAVWVTRVSMVVVEEWVGRADGR